MDRPNGQGSEGIGKQEVGVKMSLFYEFCLDDYAAPSCTSGYKYYYGTKENFKDLIDNLEKGKCNYLKEVYEEFSKGNNKVENVAGFTKVRFAKRITVLASKKIDTSMINYEYINPYQWDYQLKIDKTENEVLLIKNGKKYSIVHRTVMTNPKYQDRFAKSGWATIDMLCGFPEMIKYQGEKGSYTLENRLYIPEKVFDKKEEAEVYFNDLEKIDYKLFFEDVFGDG